MDRAAMREAINFARKRLEEAGTDLERALLALDRAYYADLSMHLKKALVQMAAAEGRIDAVGSVATEWAEEY